jgi:hypothetical protein
MTNVPPGPDAGVPPMDTRTPVNWPLANRQWRKLLLYLAKEYPPTRFPSVHKRRLAVRTRVVAEHVRRMRAALYGGHWTQRPLSVQERQLCAAIAQAPTAAARLTMLRVLFGQGPLSPEYSPEEQSRQLLFRALVVVQDLLEWDSIEGRWDAPCWQEANRFHDQLTQYLHATRTARQEP